MNILLPLFAALAMTAAAHAQTADPAAPLAEATVRKVDAANGKLTLRHGPIANLDMPPMTMVFRVATPDLLDGLKAGDAVRFAAERRDGAYTVTRIERLP